MSVREQIKKIKDLLSEDNWWGVPIAYVSTWLFVFAFLFGVIIEPFAIPLENTNWSSTLTDRRILHLIVASIITPHILLIMSWIQKRRTQLGSPSAQAMLARFFQVIEENGTRSLGTIKVICQVFTQDKKSVVISPELIVKSLDQKIEEWSKLSSRKNRPQNEETFDHLAAAAILTVANIASANNLHDKETYIKKYEKYLEDSAYSHAPIIDRRVKLARSIINANGEKVDCDRFGAA